MPSPCIPRGAGRSYGDAAYVTNGTTLSLESFDKILAFDDEHGLLTCQSGVRMIDIFDYLENSSWTLPVGGGTRWVTVGGAIGSDIHGKNHFHEGSFGNHIESMQVLLASGESLLCSAAREDDLYKATIGGMGLTGVIQAATIKLKKAASKTLLMKSKAITSPQECTAYFSEHNHPFEVAWLSLTGKNLQGVYYEGQFVQGAQETSYKKIRPIEINFPRIKLFNNFLLRFLNEFRYRTQINKNEITHIKDFHYQVDILKHWNKFYGRKGFHEFQFAVPAPHLEVVLDRFISEYKRHRLTPFFAVLKKFGPIPPQGLISFPLEGYTLMADFEYRAENEKFFQTFIDFVLELGGRTYLAKDSYTTAAQFEKMYENLTTWRETVKKFDPQKKFQSDLSRRLNLKNW
jgi:FAD/FMN-containing dehydrogenase